MSEEDICPEIINDEPPNKLMPKDKKHEGLKWKIVGDQIGFPMTTKEIIEMYAEEFGYSRASHKQPQRQDSLNDQMETVKTLARNAGCHDALDWLNNNFGKSQQPSEKKALSVDYDKAWKLVRKCYMGEMSMVEFMRAIHSALPAQREVRYPEKMEHNGWCSVETDCDIRCDCGADKFNEAIDEFKKLNGG